MNQAAVYGKLSFLNIFPDFAFFFSIVMEYSDNGDLFQKITWH